MKKIISIALAGLLLSSSMCFAGLDEGLAAAKKGDFKTAFQNLLPLAKQGNPVAQQKVGWMYGEGKGVQKNHKEEMNWFLKSAEQGNAKAQYSIGYNYAYGEGVTQNYKEAMSWYRKAAAQGLSYAQTEIGTLYAFGSGVTQSYEEAATWFRKAAEQGDDEGQLKLGAVYCLNEFSLMDKKEGIFWLRKSAEQGNATAKKLLTDQLESQRENESRSTASKPKQTEAERYEEIRAYGCATSNYDCKTNWSGGKY